MELRTRLAESIDAPIAAGLLGAFNREFSTPTPDRDVLTARFAQLLADPALLVVLAEISEPVGFAMVTLRPTPYYDGPLAQLDELYVVPDLRGGGIGTRILEEVMAAVTARGAHEMHINVDEIDASARRFYERHGFTNIEAGADYRMLCYLKEF